MYITYIYMRESMSDKKIQYMELGGWVYRLNGYFITHTPVTSWKNVCSNFITPLPS